MEPNTQQTEEQAPVSSAALREALTPKERKFADAYLENGFNGTQAALSAGYKNGPGIRQTAHTILTKADVKAYITQSLRESAITSEEVKEMITDLSRGSLNNYMVTKHVEHTPKIKVSLLHVIQQLREQISFEQEVFAATCDSMTDDEKEAYHEMIKRWEGQITRSEIELKRNPTATRIVNGPTELVEVAELDVVALARDKKLGRIKSFKQTRDGVQVETYAADGAIAQLAKIVGVAPADQTNVSVTVHLAPGEAKAISGELENKY